jgi:PAS domain S-box-containing protein
MATSCSAGCFLCRWDLRVMNAQAHAQHFSAPAEECLFQEFPLTCLLLDADGNITDVNAYGLELLGYSSAEYAGKTLPSLVHDADAYAVKALLRVATTGGRKSTAEEIRIAAKDGRVLWFRCTAQALSTPRMRVLVVCEEISRRKKADELSALYQGDLESLAVTSVLAEERERRRIASGLHDQVGHLLALANMRAAELSAAAESAENRQTAVEISRYLDETIKVTRALIFDLSSPILYELGLEAALESLVERVQEQTGLQTSFESDLHTLSVPEQTAIMIYRMVDELVFNVVKHASAHNVRLSVFRVENYLHIRVEDDGVGLPLAPADGKPKPSGRFGLFSIRTQTAQLGGHFDINSVATGGVRAELCVPVPPTRDGARQTH